MRRAIALTAAAIALLGVLVPTTASAESPPNQSSDLNISEIEIEPEGAWTDERIAQAMSNEMPAFDLGSDAPPSQGSEARGIFGPTSFPEEAQQTLAWGTTPSPLPATITHAGIVHSLTVGKIIAQYDDPTKSGPAEDYPCTGTVVTSESESLLITAGHCVRPVNGGIISSAIFVPAYHVIAPGIDQAPAGMWNIKAVATKDCWRLNFESKCDQAFMKVAPRDSDGKSLQDVVGSVGLTIGGSPERGQTPTNPFWPHLTMLGYPVESQTRFPDVDVDEGRAYLCADSTVASDQDAVFEGAVEFYCNTASEEPQPILGGMSGAALMEMSPGGQTAIGTLVGRPKFAGDLDQPLFSRLNNTYTKEMWEELDNYVLN